MDQNNEMKPAFRRRNQKYDTGRIKIAAAAVAAVMLLGGAAIFARKNPGTPGGTPGGTAAGTAQTAETTAAETLSPAELEAKQKEEEIEKEIASFGDIGIVRVDGYLNMHSEGSQESDIIGKLYGGSACEILDTTEEGWLHVTSGGIEGYVHPDYVITGEEARMAARDEIMVRAIVNADKLFVRAEPSTEAQAMGSVLKNERYVVREEKDGWVRISEEGWVSGEYVTIRRALNVARKLDLRSMVLNMYGNLGVSEVQNYLNIRKEPKEDGEIIGKLTSKAGCDILATEGEWYKIHSGDVTGYVKSEFIATGEKAKEEAVTNASLMAIVTTDILNARSEPQESAKIWTQLQNNERFPVLAQMDGWVRIELDEEDEVYVKSEYVDVRYALNEAVHFSPAEEAAMASASRRQQIVNFATQFLGNPYVCSLTNGCDCSGFTMKVMEQFGVSLPHYSGSQAQCGTKVDSSSMRPGDLIFYGNKSGTINHVSMYIGNGQIVHAASRRSGIKISTWNYRSPKAIRNVLGD